MSHPVSRNRARFIPMPQWPRRATHQATLLSAVMLATTSAYGGNNGYNVTYNSKIEKGETELMLMNDITQPSLARREEGLGSTYLSHMAELEHAITDQLATEFMVEWFEDLGNRDLGFGGFRWETRYRLFRHKVPLNPMVYAEFENLDPRTRFKMEVSGWVRPPYQETEAEPDRERILETRLVLSEDFGPVNVAFNWINETDIRNGRTAFGYAAGAMWMRGHHAGHAMDGTDGAESYACSMHLEVKQPGPGTCPKCGMSLTEVGRPQPDGGGEHGGGAGVGLEAYGGLGDSKSFGFVPSRQEHYVGPIIMYHLTGRLMMHIQLAIGLSKTSDNLVRLNFGYDF